MKKTPRYIVAGRYPWDKVAYSKIKLPGRWRYAQYPFGLTAMALAKYKPDCVFVLHWSKIIPTVKFYKFIGFHMTDLPYGRGGTPLQNLIMRGHTTTKLTAFRLTAQLDGGPIYLKSKLSLRGTAHEIYTRASLLAVDMIRQIVSGKAHPRPQDGPITHFYRRKPLDSQIGGIASLRGIYDFVRMLDADGYPRAFLKRGKYRYEFSQARLKRASLEAKVKITCES